MTVSNAKAERMSEVVEIRERRIPFKAEMVLALLSVKKSETRRVIRRPRNAGMKQVFGDYYPAGRWWVGPHPHGGWWGVDNPAGPGEWLQGILTRDGLSKGFHCPYGQPGDIILATETWRIGNWSLDSGEVQIDYKADGYRSQEWIKVADPDRFERYAEQCTDDAIKAGLEMDNADCFQWEPGQSPCRWRPARYMPKEFSRIRRVLDSVGAGPLCNITPEQALAEGVTYMPTYLPPQEPMDLVRAFAYYWGSINPKYPYSSNPFVYTLGLRKED